MNTLGGNAVCYAAHSFGTFRFARRRTTPRSDLRRGVEACSQAARLAFVLLAPASAHRPRQSNLSHHRRVFTSTGSEHHERKARRAAAAAARPTAIFPGATSSPCPWQRAGGGDAFGRRGAAHRRNRHRDRDAGRQLRRRLHPPVERCPSRRADLARRLRPAPGHARDGPPPRRRRLRGAGAQSLLPRRQGAAIRDRGERRLRRAGNARQARPADGLDQRARRRREGCRGLRRLPRRAARRSTARAGSARRATAWAARW